MVAHNSVALTRAVTFLNELGASREAARLSGDIRRDEVCATSQVSADAAQHFPRACPQCVVDVWPGCEHEHDDGWTCEDCCEECAA